MIALARGPIGRERFCYAIVLVFAVDLSLGLHGLTYRLLRVLPVSAGLRVPARAAMLVLAMVAIVAGYGVARMIARPVLPWASPQRLTAMLMLLLLVEYAHQPIQLEPLPTGPSAFEAWLRARPTGILLHLPLPQADRMPGAEARFEFASTFDWHPMVNGYSGFLPAAYLQLLERMRGFPDAASMDALRQRRVRWIVVHEDEYLGRKGMFVGGIARRGWGSQWGDHREMPYVGVPFDRLIDALTAWSGVTFVGRFASSLGAVRVYELLTPR
jgi:hypothetical protein